MRLILALTMLLAVAGHASDADKMAEFYSWHAKAVDPELVRYVGQETKRFGRLLDLNDAEIRTMLCMWHRESAYDPKADDSHMVGYKKRSLGLTQTRRDYFTRLRKFWKDKGVSLGSFDDPSTQVAFGVAEFHEKLLQSKGDLFEAVRRYNGGGHRASCRHKIRAREYAHKVFITRRLVYGDPEPEKWRNPCQ